MPDSEPVRPRASEALEAGMTASPASAGAVSKAMVKYGELVILGYNGQLPQGKEKIIFLFPRLTSFIFFVFDLKSGFISQSNLEKCQKNSSN